MRCDRIQAEIMKREKNNTDDKTIFVECRDVVWLVQQMCMRNAFKYVNMTFKLPKLALLESTSAIFWFNHNFYLFLSLSLMKRIRSNRVPSPHYPHHPFASIHRLNEIYSKPYYMRGFCDLSIAFVVSSFFCITPKHACTYVDHIRYTQQKLYMFCVVLSIMKTSELLLLVRSLQIPKLN